MSLKASDSSAGWAFLFVLLFLAIMFGEVPFLLACIYEFFLVFLPWMRRGISVVISTRVIFERNVLLIFALAIRDTGYLGTCLEQRMFKLQGAWEAIDSRCPFARAPSFRSQCVASFTTSFKLTSSVLYKASIKLSRSLVRNAGGCDSWCVRSGPILVSSAWMTGMQNVHIFDIFFNVAWIQVVDLSQISFYFFSALLDGIFVCLIMSGTHWIWVETAARPHSCYASLQNWYFEIVCAELVYTYGRCYKPIAVHLLMYHIFDLRDPF